MELQNLTLEQLKAMVYDRMRARGIAEEEIHLINAEIDKKEKAA